MMNNIIFGAGFFLGLLALIDLPFFGIVIARHYDKLFPKYVQNKDVFENQYWIFSPILRGCNYAGCIMFKNYSKKSLRKVEQNYFFKGYDFRANARFVDWLVLGVFFGSVFIMALFAVTLLVINGFHWPSA